jgi:hypothetical protein
LGVVVILLVAVFLRLPAKSEGEVKVKPKRKVSKMQFLCQLDLGGSALLIASMVALFLAMQWGGHHLPWTSPTIICLFTVSGILLALFVLLDWKMGDDASVPFRVLGQRSIASGAVYLFFFAMPNFSVRIRWFGENGVLLTRVVWSVYTDVLSSCARLQRTEKWHGVTFPDSDADPDRGSCRSACIEDWVLCQSHERLFHFDSDTGRHPSSS